MPGIGGCCLASCFGACPPFLLFTGVCVAGAPVTGANMAGPFFAGVCMAGRGAAPGSAVARAAWLRQNCPGQCHCQRVRGALPACISARDCVGNVWCVSEGPLHAAPMPLLTQSWPACLLMGCVACSLSHGLLAHRVYGMLIQLWLAFARGFWRAWKGCCHAAPAATASKWELW